MPGKNFFNSIWSIVDVILYPAIYLLFTPYFVQQLGIEKYGIWMLVNTMVVFMQIFNFGLGINTQRNVSLAIGKSNFSLVPQIIGSNLSIVLFIALICIFFGIGFATFQYRLNFFHISKSNEAIATISICFSGLIVGLKFIEQIFTNSLIAFEKIALVSFYNTIVRIVLLGISLLLIWSNVSIVFIFVSNIIVLLSALAVLYYFLMQITGKSKIPLSVDKEKLKQEFKKTKWIWYQSIFVIIAFQCDKFLVAHWLGVKQFSYYSIVSTIFNHIHLAIMAIVPWALPQIVKRHADNGNVKDYYFYVRSIIHFFSFLGIVVFFFSYRFIFTLWVGEKLMLELSETLKLYMVFELFFVFTISPFYLLNAIEKGRLATINTIIYSTLSLLGMTIGYLIEPSVKSIILGAIISLMVSMLIQQYLIARAQGYSVFFETIGLITPTLCLSAYILVDFQIPIFKYAILILGITSFLYIYLIKFPVQSAIFYPKQIK